LGKSRGVGHGVENYRSRSMDGADDDDRGHTQSDLTMRTVPFP
jgi:hypothetical protein